LNKNSKNYHFSFGLHVYTLKGSDDGILHLKETGFWTLSILEGFLKNMTFRKLDPFPYSGKKKVAPTLLGPLERASLNHWTTSVRKSKTYKHLTSSFVSRR
jgi:hypothetical protein